MKIQALWVPWNDLYSKTSEIALIPASQINAVYLALQFPMEDGINGTAIAAAIQQFHQQGMTIIAYLNLEAWTADWDTRATSYGDEVIAATLQTMLGADGTPTIKAGGPITTFFDPNYRAFVQRKINLLRGAGVDYIMAGEFGYMVSGNNNFDSTQLEAFSLQTDVSLPTTTLGSTLAAYIASNASVGMQSAWFLWKHQQLYAWLKTLGVDGVERELGSYLGYPFNSPPLPSAALNPATYTQFVGDAPPIQATYDTAQAEINALVVPGAINLGNLFYVNAACNALTAYPEDLANRANFLSSQLEGFRFFGGPLWLQYKSVIEYLPELNTKETSAMAANKVIRFGPAALAASIANIVNPNLTSLSGPVGFTLTQPYLILRHIRLVNKTAAAVTVSLYIGATGASAAGTEFIGTALSIAANSALDWYGMVRLDAADFLTGLASAATSITFEAEGEIGIS